MKKLLRDLTKRYGDDVVTLASRLDLKGQRLPFGISPLDEILGGGIPVSRLVEIYGPEQAGKTTLAYCLISEAQKVGIPVYIDLEGQWDPDWATLHGVDPNRLLIIRPVAAEAAIDAVLESVKKGVPLVVLDSIAAMEPVKSLKRRVDEPLVGQIPLLLNRVIRRILIYQKSSSTIVLFLNQLRDRVTMGRPLFGSGDMLYSTPGGRGLRHFVHLRLFVDRYGYITKKSGDKKERVGHKLIVKVTKSKISIPFRDVVLELRYDKGLARGSA